MRLQCLCERREARNIHTNDHIYTLPKIIHIIMDTHKDCGCALSMKCMFPEHTLTTHTKHSIEEKSLRSFPDIPPRVGLQLGSMPFP